MRLKLEILQKLIGVNMKKQVLKGAITVALGLSSFGAHALTATSTLNFVAGGEEVVGCNAPFVFTAGSCTLGGVDYTDTGAIYGMAGSWFAMDNDGLAQGTPTTGVEGSIGDESKIAIAPASDGTKLTLGSPTPAGKYVDQPWNFFSAVGQHKVIGSGLSMVSANEIDMTGWTVYWGNPAGDIDMGAGVASSDSRSVDQDGLLAVGNTAVLTCDDGNVCGDGANFELDYSAVVPPGVPGFSGVLYTLHLEGTISEIPVPAAVWLFGSGLLGLVGVARRKAHA